MTDTSELKGCMEEVGDTLERQRHLLKQGLQLTDAACYDYLTPEQQPLCVYQRLLLLQYQNRLDTLLSISNGYVNALIYTCVSNKLSDIQ